jgi:hypothetical protein
MALREIAQVSASIIAAEDGDRTRDPLLGRNRFPDSYLGER